MKLYHGSLEVVSHPEDALRYLSFIEAKEVVL